MISGTLACGIVAHGQVDMQVKFCKIVNKSHKIIRINIVNTGVLGTREVGAKTARKADRPQHAAGDFYRATIGLGFAADYFKQREFTRTIASKQCNSFTFQITPRLSGTFRYAGLYGVAKCNGTDIRDTFNSSFDLRYQIAREGSFDKGIRVSVPTDFFLGNASLRAVTTNLSSLARDGGAKVNVDGRRYDNARRQTLVYRALV